MKEYNMRMGTYLLDFPNNEVRRGFFHFVYQLLQAPEQGDE